MDWPGGCGRLGPDLPGVCPCVPNAEDDPPLTGAPPIAPGSPFPCCLALRGQRAGFSWPGEPVWQGAPVVDRDHQAAALVMSTACGLAFALARRPPEDSGLGIVVQGVMKWPLGQHDQLRLCGIHCVEVDHAAGWVRTTSLTRAGSCEVLPPKFSIHPVSAEGHARTEARSTGRFVFADSVAASAIARAATPSCSVTGRADPALTAVTKAAHSAA